MKKTVMLFAMLVLPLVGDAAWSFEWYNTDGSPIYVPVGSPGTVGEVPALLPNANANYTFALYLSGNQTFEDGSDILAYSRTGNQVSGGAGNFYGGALNTGTTPNLPFLADPTYDYVVTVLYIGTPSSYSAYAVLGANGLPASDPSPSSAVFEVAGITQGNVGTTWQVVPEPSSIALLGLGLGLVALRRKMRK